MSNGTDREEITQPGRPMRPRDQRLMEPAPPSDMETANQISVAIASSMSQTMDTLGEELVRTSRINKKLAILAILMGVRRVECVLLHLMEKDGAPMESIRGTLDRLEASEMSRMKEIDNAPKVISTERKLVIPK